MLTRIICGERVLGHEFARNPGVRTRVSGQFKCARWGCSLNGNFSGERLLGGGEALASATYSSTSSRRRRRRRAGSSPSIAISHSLLPPIYARNLACAIAVVAAFPSIQLASRLVPICPCFGAHFLSVVTLVASVACFLRSPSRRVLIAAFPEPPLS